MSQDTTSCALCGHFELYNATSAFTFDYEEPATIYDTLIKTSSGLPTHAKLIIAHDEAEQYPDATIICAIARAGPMYPFGFILQTTRILTLTGNTPLYWDVFTHCRMTSICKILDTTADRNNNRAYFILECVTNISGCEWYWNMRYAN